MKRKDKYVIANMKMSLSRQAELDHWLTSFTKAKKQLALGNTSLVICPPEIYLERFVTKIKTEGIEFGVQNCFWEEKGAFTGETSPVAVHSLGASYVILGHSERRRFLGETDEVVALKVKVALKARLRPVLCIGEDARQKKQDQMMEVVLKQLSNCLSQVSRGLIEEVIICYEPVWAISANKPDHLPSSNEIMGAKLLIRKFLLERYGKSSAERVKIIYGGSVDVDNIEEVVIESGMDGALIGSASLRPYDLVKIANIIEERPVGQYIPSARRREYI